MFFNIFSIWQEKTLAKSIIATVEHPVDRLQTKIAHPLVISIRVHQRNGQASPPGLGQNARLLLGAQTIFFNQVT